MEFANKSDRLLFNISLREIKEILLDTDPERIDKDFDEVVYYVTRIKELMSDAERTRNHTKEDCVTEV